MTQLVLTPTRSITHDCLGAMDCGVDAPGHAIGFMQQRLATASSSKWRDTIVEGVAADGWLRLRTVDDNLTLRVWNHAGLAELLPGTPVALHSLYNVLAAGAERFNVAVTAG